MEKKEQTKKLVIRGIIVVCSAIILFIAIDLINVLAFKGKPFIIINETDTKQSSILYDIYECNEERIFKLKGTKFTCPKENQKVSMTAFILLNQMIIMRLFHCLSKAQRKTPPVFLYI